MQSENAYPKSGISPPPTNRGPKNHLFGPTSQLNCNFNRLYLRNDTYRQSVKCVDNYEGSPTSSQNKVNFGPQTASNSTTILPTLRKFCCLLNCHAALQTDTSKRNSTKLCQTVDSKLRQQSAVEKSGSFVPKNWGPKNFNICSVFDDFET